VRVRAALAHSCRPDLPALPAHAPSLCAAGPAARRLDESFVVLPGSSSSGRGGGGGSGGGGGGASGAQSVLLEGGPGGSSGSGSGVQRIPFDQKLRALGRVFEVASEEAGVDFPLCPECAAEVHRELETQLAELQQVGWWLCRQEIQSVT
jgi:hypothetical protein